MLVENFRTGVLERLGLGIEELMRRNPRLVVLSITGFGHDGPEGGRAGYDQIAQGEAGLMSLTGSGPDDPQRVGVPIADLLSGMYGAYGVLAALHERERTGKGRSCAPRCSPSVGRRARLPGHPVDRGRRGRPRAGQPPSRRSRPTACSTAATARSRSRSAARACGSASATGFGLDPAADGLATNGERVAHRERVIEVVEAAFADWDAEPLLARLAEVGVPAGKVRTLDEVYEWDQVASQGLLLDVEHASLGHLTLPGPPLRFFDAGGRRGHPARARRAAAARPARRRDPCLGRAPGDTP